MRISDWSSDVCSSDLAHLRGSSDDESHLGFDVEAPGRSEVRAFLIGCLPLSAGTNDVGAGDDDGARARVVSDGKKIGRASWREGVCQVVSISMVVVALKTDEMITLRVHGRTNS